MSDSQDVGIPIPIVIRSHNECDLLSQTLEAVRTQNLPYELHVFDNDSEDGTAALLPQYTKHIHRVPKGTYIPGKVLNEAMRQTNQHAPFVVFLNSDCTPLNEHWLEELIKGFADPTVAAVFGRQVPRPDCEPLFEKDTNDTFGDGERQKYWKHCFSMASSAIRRECWEEVPFSETLTYSEDIDWTWKARQRGWTIKYSKDSQVYHSHNYSYSQFRKRQRGEGKADAQIFSWTPWERSFVRYSLLPYLRQVKSDWGYTLSQREFRSFFYAPILRFAQLRGRREGFLKELKETDFEHLQ
ncbi:MAG: glycosyltransferase family 2 protein [Sphaerochaeta sp.]|nr:glycosyltransferase family 2 protein [Sphaerochaeta sp.]